MRSTGGGTSVNYEEKTALRQLFEKAMGEAGWTPMHDRFGATYNWKYKTGYTVEDGNAFRFWRMAGLTPVPW